MITKQPGNHALFGIAVFALTSILVLPRAAAAESNPPNLKAALLFYTWTWDKFQAHKKINFQEDGHFYVPKEGMHKWSITGPQTVRVTYFDGTKGTFTFDREFKTYTNSHQIHGTRLETREALDSDPKNGPAAANSAPSKAPESRIEELIERKNIIVEDIFGPLNNPVPTSIREYLADLRENLLDEAAKKPVAGSNAYDLGVRFCNGLISAYDEREIMAARLRNNTPSNAAGKPNTMKDHPNWVDYVRERAEARAATHDNKLETAFARNTKLQWSQRSEQLRKALDAFYAQFRQAARQPVAAKQ